MLSVSLNNVMHWKPLFIMEDDRCSLTSTKVGASTVKWTTLDPCSGLSENDPKLYTNFKFYEIEIHKYL